MMTNEDRSNRFFGMVCILFLLANTTVMTGIISKTDNHDIFSIGFGILIINLVIAALTAMASAITMYGGLEESKTKGVNDPL